MPNSISVGFRSAPIGTPANLTFPSNVNAFALIYGGVPIGCRNTARDAGRRTPGEAHRAAAMGGAFDIVSIDVRGLWDFGRASDTAGWFLAKAYQVRSHLVDIELIPHPRFPAPADRYCSLCKGRACRRPEGLGPRLASPPTRPGLRCRPCRGGAVALNSHNCPQQRNRWFADLYGAFPVKRLFWVLLSVFCSERERPFFVPSPAIRFPERAEGVKGPKR